MQPFANARPVNARLATRLLPWLSGVLVCSFCCCVGFADDTKEKIAKLEARLSQQKSGSFDWSLHNELRHLYAGIDPKKSMSHVEVILKQNVLDGYIMGVLSGFQFDKAVAIRSLSKTATEYSEFPNVAAACWIWAGDLAKDPKTARSFYSKAWKTKNANPGYREALEDRLLFAASSKKLWPNEWKAPKNMEDSPGPWSDPDTNAIWPNTTSRANSDAWLAEHHDEIRTMKPRVLVINFSNEHPREHLDRLLEQIKITLAESSRYHGYRDPQAPVFLDYQVFKFVELRDQDRAQGNSRKVPLKDPKATSGFNVKYRQFFTQEYADYYAIPDPRNPKRNLRLDELLDGGYIHEVWFFLSGQGKEVPQIGAFEVVEEKPKYDESFQRIGNDWVQAGNGGDVAQPWAGRSCRIGFINASRGIGCFLESLSHGMEHTSSSRSIPYLSKYFDEFADFNLKQRYQVPFNALYEVDYGGQQITFLSENTAKVTHAGKQVIIDNYIPAGGSVHFPPNARSHYDLQNPNSVLSTIEDWRIGSGPNGQDIAKPFSNQAFRRYGDIAPDCMGSWLVYWRQNMPGLDNKQKDAEGKPMKNWWPFLFY